MMGERKVPECDIFGTLQSKGLRIVHVKAVDVADDDPTSDCGKRVLFECELEVGERGLTRVLRMVKAATQPPKTRGAGKTDA